MHILQIQSLNWSIVHGLENRAARIPVSKPTRHVVMLRTSIQGLGHKSPRIRPIARDNKAPTRVKKCKQARISMKILQ
jgi:hypothetical protein